MISRRRMLMTAVSANILNAAGGPVFAQTVDSEAVLQIYTGEFTPVGAIIEILIANGEWPEFLPPELFYDLPYYDNLRLAMCHLLYALAYCQDALDQEEAAEELRRAVGSISGRRFGVSEAGDLSDAQDAAPDLDLERLSEVRSEDATRLFRYGGLHAGVSFAFHGICALTAREIAQRASRNRFWALRNARTIRLVTATVDILPKNIRLARGIHETYEAFRAVRDLPTLSEIEARAAMEEF